MKKFLSALIVSTLMFSATACSSQSAKNTGQEQSTTAQAVESSKEQTTEAATEQKSQEGVVKFTDSAGREVELPANIEKIALQDIWHRLCFTPLHLIRWSDGVHSIRAIR